MKKCLCKHSIKLKENWKINTSILLIILVLSQFTLLACSSCDSNSKISDTSACFNEIIKFGRHSRGGQLSLRKDGNLIIEYSDSGTRTFYGLKKMGEVCLKMKKQLKKLI